ncbi:unnamed protein product, partial [Heterotrigona itama]
EDITKTLLLWNFYARMRVFYLSNWISEIHKKMALIGQGDQVKRHVDSNAVPSTTEYPLVEPDPSSGSPDFNGYHIVSRHFHPVSPANLPSKHLDKYFSHKLNARVLFVGVSKNLKITGNPKNKKDLCYRISSALTLAEAKILIVITATTALNSTVTGAAMQQGKTRRADNGITFDQKRAWVEVTHAWKGERKKEQKEKGSMNDAGEADRQDSPQLGARRVPQTPPMPSCSTGNAPGLSARDIPLFFPSRHDRDL